MGYRLFNDALVHVYIFNSYNGGLVMRIDLGELCVHCGNSTAFGSGRFVDRYPVFWLQRDGDGIEYTGYCCNECELAFEAERGE